VQNKRMTTYLCQQIMRASHVVSQARNACSQVRGSHAMPCHLQGGGAALLHAPPHSSPNQIKEIDSGPRTAANLPGTLCFPRPLHSPLPPCRVPRHMKHPLHPSLCMSAGFLLAHVLFCVGEFLKLLLDFGCSETLSAYSHTRQLETPVKLYALWSCLLCVEQ
jgi:hypothetical protein